MTDFLSRLFKLEKFDVQFTCGIRTIPPEWNPYRYDETYLQMTSGQILSSHYWLNPALQSLIEEDGVLAIYLYRDPRDVLISIANYYKYANIHVVFYPYFSELSEDEAITTVITGASIPVEKVHLPENVPANAPNHMYYEGISYFCRQALPWLSSPKVSTMRFEDFSVDLVDTVYNMLNQTPFSVSRERIRDIQKSVNFYSASGGRRPGEEQKTSHFRNGLTGQYKTVFSKLQKDLCKQKIGHDLIQLGYENDMDW
jgi:hypothetical protein